MSKKIKTPKVEAPEVTKSVQAPAPAPEPEVKSNPDEEKVTLIERCMYAGVEKSIGDKLTVTKNQAQHLRSRKLIK